MHLLPVSIVLLPLVWQLGAASPGQEYQRDYKLLLHFSGTRGTDHYCPCRGILGVDALRPLDNKFLCKEFGVPTKPSLAPENFFCHLLNSACHPDLVLHEDDLSRPALSKLLRSLSSANTVVFKEFIESRHMLARCSERGIRMFDLPLGWIPSTFINGYARSLMDEADPLAWLAEACLSEKEVIGPVPGFAPTQETSDLIELGLTLERGLRNFGGKKFKRARQEYDRAYGLAYKLLVQIVDREGPEKIEGKWGTYCIKKGAYPGLFSRCIGSDPAKLFLGIVVLSAKYMAAWSEMKGDKTTVFSKEAIDKMGRFSMSGAEEYYLCTIVEAFRWDWARLDACQAQ